MALKSFRPLTAALRFTTLNRPDDIADKRPERSLVESKNKSGGRNTYGRITSRRRGGGHKKLYRIIDFKRSKLDMPAKVQAIEYDPNRSALLALVAYADGSKAYILAPQGLKAGDSIYSALKTDTNDFRPGNSFLLHLYIGNATSGEDAISTYDQGNPIQVQASEDQLFKQVLDAIVGQPRGSRVAVTAPVEPKVKL